MHGPRQNLPGSSGSQCGRDEIDSRNYSGIQEFGKVRVIDFLSLLALSSLRSPLIYVRNQTYAYTVRLSHGTSCGWLHDIQGAPRKVENGDQHNPYLPSESRPNFPRSGSRTQVNPLCMTLDDRKRFGSILLKMMTTTVKPPTPARIGSWTLSSLCLSP
jgi:hypothetical protein